MSKIIQLAKKFAIYHHGVLDQRRKYTGEPYHVHPFAVAELVRCANGSVNMIAAAILHDTLEDCPSVTVEMLLESFGKPVTDLVIGLTDTSKPEDGNRAVRMQMNIDRMSKQCASVKTIKLADIIDNLKSIKLHDPKFAVSYFAEKRAMLPHLAEGETELYWRLHRTLL
jgi:(p)ppGpp synthase/HD superfamily hydrolase